MTAPDPTARAAAALDVPADATPDAARAAFLRKLADADFAPPEGWVAAVNRLGGANVPLSPDAVADAADAVRDEVDAFAAAFWSLTPEVRRATWSDLHARCPAGPTAAFLLHLEIGLSAPTAPLPDPATEELAAFARELFVLRPRPRAVRRGEWLSEHAAAGPALTAAARRIEVDVPALAVLDRPLFGRLSGKGGRTLAVPPSARVPTPEPELANFHRATDEYRERLATPRTQASAPPAGSDGSDASALKTMGALLFVVVLIIRAVVGIGSWAAGPSAPQNSGYSPPAIYSPPQAPGRRVFTPEEVAKFKAYQASEFDQKYKPSPPGYIEWIVQGGGGNADGIVFPPIVPSTRR